MEHQRFAIGVTCMSFLLGISILICCSSQISRTWWKIETVKDVAHVDYYFGLYEVCVQSSAAGESCFSFDIDGMRRFMLLHKKDNGVSNQLLSDANDARRKLASLSCIAVLFTCLSFFMSLFATWKSWRNTLPVWMPYAQFTMATFAAILGVASVAYAYDNRDVVWLPGLQFLQSEGLATGEVKTSGLGFTLQFLYTVLCVITMMLYVCVAHAHPDPKHETLVDCEAIEIHKPFIVVDDTFHFTLKG